MKKSKFMGLVVSVLFVVVCIFYSCKKDEFPSKSTSSTSYLNFPTPVSSSFPYDIDVSLKAQLDAENSFDEVQRLFEILSWQFFIGLNWPTNAEGVPQPMITDPGNPVWYDWKESYEVFKSDGSAPTAWGNHELPAELKVNLDPNKKILFRTSKLAEFHHTDTADEISQAFTSPIWDQSGNVVRYEVRMNQVEFGYILKNKLYNLNGQINFSKNVAKKVTFPSGDLNTAGVFEIKIAWKIMEPEVDDTTRYFTANAEVIDTAGNFSTAKVGMIGMHISTKTKSSPQWIWTTYEHVDNLRTNPLDKVNGKPLKPSFYDPDCETCPVNLYPKPVNGVIKNQIQRIIPISKATEDLNRQVQGILADAGSKLQYYEQVGTQWPTKPSAPPYMPTDPNDTVYELPEAVTNKSGGFPTPVYLTNMIMETYFQGGTATSGNAFSINEQFIDISSNNLAYEKLYSGKNGNKTEGYNIFIGNEPAFFQIQGFPFDENTINTQAIIFGTESCVGCHYSGAIANGAIKKADGSLKATFGDAGDSDFSWLLQLKAQFADSTQQL